jgi:hypothetical protein
MVMARAALISSQRAVPRWRHAFLLLSIVSGVIIACGGSPARPSPTPEIPTFHQVLAGRVADVLHDTAVAGAAIHVERFGDGASGSDGRFNMECECPNETVRLTVDAPNFVERVTSVVTPGASIDVTLMPAAFNSQAFDEMFRGFAAGVLTRWVDPPGLVIERSLLDEWDDSMATEAQLTDAEIGAAVSQMSAMLSELSGGVFQTFRSIEVVSTLPDMPLELKRSGAITMVHYTTPGVDSDGSRFCGRGGPSYNSTFIVSSGTIWLDRRWADCNPTTAGHELGHALGYNHVTSARSIMNAPSAPMLTDFDHEAALVAFRRTPGNRAPDADPVGAVINPLSGPAHGTLISPSPIP